ncbi:MULTISPECIES: HugZ family protein [unclassified Meridianimarinicoccus]|uniref:HugZ family pyridoxamine 5'-phosphate oxidase n=1 Tax=unclassified Meridianimarinicoccus TaxID=2923344 RepID=UPI0018673152|nr:pyridoxamine 5'-phosphate oxidase family protein [Fluviibacterium sp. MJW13]
MSKPSPIRPTDDEARALARRLLADMRFAALGVLHPDTGLPEVTRVALIAGPDGAPLSLVSDLSAHTRALRANPSASLLVGEPGGRGDPLTHPRMTLACTARFIGHGDPQHADLRAHYLRVQPKARLYVDFADFSFVRFSVRGAALNGGFGKAFHLSPQDLEL